VYSTGDNRLPSGVDGYPLLAEHAADDMIAWHDGKAISSEAFLHDVHTVAANLPGGQYAINLCEDRYWFLVGFAALLVNNQTNLLPPSRASRIIAEIASDYGNAYCICDNERIDIGIRTHRIDTATLCRNPVPCTQPRIPASHLAAIVFTSGSTGKSRPNSKYWKDLVIGAKMKQNRFGFGGKHMQQTIIATVPPQHMYGLETSILNPLINGVSVYSDKTFFPADVFNALHSINGPRVLITTPVHLRSFLAAGLQFPAPDFIVSATAPLDKALARRAEEVFDCPLLEIYGCTEAGSLASRRTTMDKHWLLYEHITIENRAGYHAVSGPNLPDEIPLHDVIEPVSTRHFNLHGRHADIINVAGKRASLEDLNARLRNIQGVLDATFLVQEHDGDTVPRLTALVVAPALDAAAIRRELAQQVDPAFLPRPLYFVAQLPRNENGKLPRTALLELLGTLRNEA
jgi:acyl-coenzyme A synthetase/AMP-(fatty) acid ligase